MMACFQLFSYIRVVEKSLTQSLYMERLESSTNHQYGFRGQGPKHDSWTGIFAVPLAPVQSPQWDGI